MSTLMAAETSRERHLQIATEGVINNQLVEVELQRTQIIEGQVQVGRIPVKYSAEIPENPIYEGWASFESGWGGYLETSEPFRHALAERGVLTVICDPARDDNDSFLTRTNNPQDIHTQTMEAIAEDLPKNQQIKADVPSARYINYNRQLLVPHSMGSLAAIPYADKHPDKVDAIISLSSVGYGSPKLGQLARAIPLGIGRAIRDELLPGLKDGDITVSPANLFRIVHYYARNPARTIGEAISCLTQDVRPTVEQLRQQDIKTAFIAFEKDILIPPNKNIENFVDLYEEMPDLGHSAPQFQAKKVAKTVIDRVYELRLSA